MANSSSSAPARHSMLHGVTVPRPKRPHIIIPKSIRKPPTIRPLNEPSESCEHILKIPSPPTFTPPPLHEHPALCDLDRSPYHTSGEDSDGASSSAFGKRRKQDDSTPVFSSPSTSAPSSRGPSPFLQSNRPPSTDSAATSSYHSSILPSPIPQHLSVAPHEIHYIWSHASLLYHCSEFPEALRTFQHLQQRNGIPKYLQPRLWVNIGVLHGQLKEHYCASEAFLAASKGTVDGTQLRALAIYLTGCSLFEAGWPRKAADCFDSCDRIFGRLPGSRSVSPLVGGESTESSAAERDSVNAFVKDGGANYLDMRDLGFEFTLRRFKVRRNRRVCLEAADMTLRWPMESELQWQLHRLPHALLFEPPTEFAVDSSRKNSETSIKYTRSQPRTPCKSPPLRQVETPAALAKTSQPQVAADQKIVRNDSAARSGLGAVSSPQPDSVPAVSEASQDQQPQMKNEQHQRSILTALSKRHLKSHEHFAKHPADGDNENGGAAPQASSSKKYLPLLTPESHSVSPASPETNEDPVPALPKCLISPLSPRIGSDDSLRERKKAHEKKRPPPLKPVVVFDSSSTTRDEEVSTIISIDEQPQNPFEVTAPETETSAEANAKCITPEPEKQTKEDQMAAQAMNPGRLPRPTPAATLRPTSCNRPRTPPPLPSTTYTPESVVTESKRETRPPSTIDPELTAEEYRQLIKLNDNKYLLSLIPSPFLAACMAPDPFMGATPSTPIGAWEDVPAPLAPQRDELKLADTAPEPLLELQSTVYKPPQGRKTSPPPVPERHPFHRSGSSPGETSSGHSWDKKTLTSQANSDSDSGSAPESSNQSSNEESSASYRTVDERNETSNGGSNTNSSDQSEAPAEDLVMQVRKIQEQYRQHQREELLEHQRRSQGHVHQRGARFAGSSEDPFTSGSSNLPLENPRTPPAPQSSESEQMMIPIGDLRLDKPLPPLPQTQSGLWIRKKPKDGDAPYRPPLAEQPTNTSLKSIDPTSGTPDIDVTGQAKENPAEGVLESGDSVMTNRASRGYGNNGLVGNNASGPPNSSAFETLVQALQSSPPGSKPRPAATTSTATSSNRPPTRGKASQEQPRFTNPFIEQFDSSHSATATNSTLKSNNPFATATSSTNVTKQKPSDNGAEANVDLRRVLEQNPPTLFRSGSFLKRHASNKNPSQQKPSGSKLAFNCFNPLTSAPSEKKQMGTTTHAHSQSQPLARAHTHIHHSKSSNECPHKRSVSDSAVAKGATTRGTKHKHSHSSHSHSHKHSNSRNGHSHKRNSSSAIKAGHQNLRLKINPDAQPGTPEAAPKVANVDAAILNDGSQRCPVPAAGGIGKNKKSKHTKQAGSFDKIIRDVRKGKISEESDRGGDDLANKLNGAAGFGTTSTSKGSSQCTELDDLANVLAMANSAGSSSEDEMRRDKKARFLVHKEGSNAGLRVVTS